MSPINWDKINAKVASLSKTAINPAHHEKMINYHYKVADSLKNLAEKYSANGDEDSQNQCEIQAEGHRQIADAHGQVRDHMNNTPRPNDRPSNNGNGLTTEEFLKNNGLSRFLKKN